MILLSIVVASVSTISIRVTVTISIIIASVSKRASISIVSIVSISISVSIALLSLGINGFLLSLNWLGDYEGVVDDWVVVSIAEGIWMITSSIGGVVVVSQGGGFDSFDSSISISSLDNWESVWIVSVWVSSKVSVGAEVVAISLGL